VLIVLALLGVFALSATLLAGRDRPAPRATRAAAKFRPSLKSMLNQGFPQLLAAGPPPAQALQQGSTSCAVDSGSCSLHPCVIFVQSSNPSMAAPADGEQFTPLVVARGRSHFRPPLAVLPTQPGGPAGGCTRHAAPHTLRVSGP
jgi:hypothetical protein